MIGGDDECRALSSRRVWGRLELSSGRTFREFPEESRGKRAGLAGGLTAEQADKSWRSRRAYSQASGQEAQAKPTGSASLILQGSLNNWFGSQILNWSFKHRFYLAVGVQELSSAANVSDLRGSYA